MSDGKSKCKHARVSYGKSQRVRDCIYAHTITERTYAASRASGTELKMAKVEKTTQSAIHAICHAKDPSNDTHHASQSPRSQSPLSKTRHNKVIRESDNTVQRVSACFVVVTCDLYLSICTYMCIHIHTHVICMDVHVGIQEHTNHIYHV